MALENLSEKLSELAQTGVAKTRELVDAGVTKAKEVSEICRLKVDNASEQEAIKKAYLEIGKLYFAERGMDPEAPYSALCEKINSSKAKIEYNLERIDDLKAAGAPVNEEEPEAGEGSDCGCSCCEDAAPTEGMADGVCTCGEEAAPTEGTADGACTCGEGAAPTEETPDGACTCGEGAAPAEETPDQPKE